MFLKKWGNPMLVGLLILFSLPLKLPALQQMLESWLSFSFPIQLSLYTLFLPPVALFCLAWNRNRAAELWQQLRFPLIVLAFLFVWMWLGSIMSEYPKIALKHSGRYSIYLLTFLAFLFALDRESSDKSGQIFIGIYILLVALTFLAWNGQIRIPGLLSDNRQVTLFFENRNPYAVVSVGVFCWSLTSLRHSWILSSLAIGAALYSIYVAGSRNGILTLILCVLFLLILTFKQFRKAHIAFILFLAATIVFGIGYYSIHNQAINRTNVTLNRLLNVKTFKDLESLDARFTLFRAAFESGIANHPILGSGTKTFGHQVFSKSANLDKYNKSWYKAAYNSHNALLTIWIEMGWVGLIAVLIFLWLWFRPALRGPPLLMMPMLAVCVGQILDYFVWAISFMAFQSFFFASFASTIYFVENKSTTQSSDNYDH